MDKMAETHGSIIQASTIIPSINATFVKLCNVWSIFDLNSNFWGSTLWIALRTFRQVTDYSGRLIHQMFIYQGTYLIKQSWCNQSTLRFLFQSPYRIQCLSRQFCSVTFIQWQRATENDSYGFHTGKLHTDLKSGKGSADVHIKREKVGSVHP